MITAMREEHQVPARRPMICEVIKAVAEHFGVSVENILGRQSHRSISRPRQIAMYMAREHCGKSTTALGREFGRDHTTVIYGAEKIARQVDADPMFARELEKIFAGMPRRGKGEGVE